MIDYLCHDYNGMTVESVLINCHYPVTPDVVRAPVGRDRQAAARPHHGPGRAGPPASSPRASASASSRTWRSGSTRPGSTTRCCAPRTARSTSCAGGTSSSTWTSRTSPRTWWRATSSRSTPPGRSRPGRPRWPRTWPARPIGGVMNRPDTLAERDEYLEGGLTGVRCDRAARWCGPRRPARMQTSVQWTGPAARSCCEFAARPPRGRPTALVPTCPTCGTASTGRSAKAGWMRVSNDQRRRRRSTGSGSPRSSPRRPDAHSLVLAVPPELAAAFAYRPGQFLTVRVPDGGAVGGPLLLAVQLAATPTTHLKITVKRVRDGHASNWICDHVRPGSTLDLAAAGRLFTPRSLDDDLLLLAGGSGITPVMAILKSVLARGSGRLALVYANRDAGLGHLRRRTGRPRGPAPRPARGDPLAGQRARRADAGRTGRGAAPRTRAGTCSSAARSRSSRSPGRRCGRPACRTERVHVERFELLTGGRRHRTPPPR